MKRRMMIITFTESAVSPLANSEELDADGWYTREALCEAVSELVNHLPCIDAIECLMLQDVVEGQ